MLASLFTAGRARRIVAWLLFAACLIGPLGAGGAALREVAACDEAACPCEDAPAAEHAEAPGEHAGACDADCEGAEVACGLGCDDCPCCPGAVLAVLPSLAPYRGVRGGVAQAQAPPADIAGGVQRRMDRPPRPA